jgi:hypothetical protein
MGVSREQLYQEVWAEPMTTVAKRYDVSSSYLARICESLGVPRPPRGYWQQLAAGTKVKRAVLPAARPGGEIEWGRPGSPARQPPVTATLPRTRRSKRERPETHALIIGARAHFDHARESDDQEYVRPYKRNLVDVLVSKAELGRALKTANELFLALEDRGQRVMLAPSSARYRHVACKLREGQGGRQDDYFSSVRWSPGEPTITFVGTVAIGLTLFEVSEEVEVRYDENLRKFVRIVPTTPAKPMARRSVVHRERVWITKRWMPSTRLALHAYASYHGVKWEQYWYEPMPEQLPSLFGAIAKQLEGAAVTIAKLVEEERQRVEVAQRQQEMELEEWRKREAEEHRKQEEQRIHDEEVRDEKAFLELIAEWRLARDVRDYVAESRALMKSANIEIPIGGGLDRHLQAATAYADRLDPLSELRVEIAKLVAVREAKCGVPPDPSTSTPEPPRSADEPER